MWRVLVESRPRTPQHEHRKPIRLQDDDEHVLDGVEEQTVAEDAKTEAVETQSEERSVLEDDDRQQTPDLGLTAAPMCHAVDQAVSATHLCPLPLTASLDGRQHDGELEQAAGPDGEDDVLQRVAGDDRTLVEQVEQLHDVERDAEVDKQQLRQLITSDDSFRQHPAANDEDQKRQLLDRVYERLPVEQVVERHQALFCKQQTSRCSSPSLVYGYYIYN